MESTGEMETALQFYEAAGRTICRSSESTATAWNLDKVGIFLTMCSSVFTNAQ